jgi:hypothetical protein
MIVEQIPLADKKIVENESKKDTEISTVKFYQIINQKAIPIESLYPKQV